MTIVLKILILVSIIGCIVCQWTVQSRIAPILTECYGNVTLKNIDNLPPLTIQTLIEIIRKIEDHPGTNGNLRELSTAITHTYRQDGMEYHPSSEGINNVLPYSPSFYTFYKHKVLLSKLMPTNSYVLDNDILTPFEKCALHHMLSTTVWRETRGDESSSCQFSQYRIGRFPRNVRPRRYIDDVEQLDNAYLAEANKNGKMVLIDPNSEVEGEGLDAVYIQRQISSVSQCPLLDGVIDTDWGAVSAGPLLAGISTGAEPQTVLVSDILRGTNNVLPDALRQLTVDTRFSATLSGDIAEATLRQGAVSPYVSVGAAGGWNATQARRFYFVQNSVNLELTEPEMRGGIDGLVLALKLSEVQNAYSGIKLSQMLDMYYSPLNGVTSSTFRACNRNSLLDEIVTQQKLLTESYHFALALDANLPSEGTIVSLEGLENLITTTVSSTISHISSSLTHTQCSATELTAVDYRAKTNLYIVVDRSWAFNAIYPAISYLLENIEVSKFGSSVTLLNAADGEIVVNKTFSSTEFHVNFTVNHYQTLTSGVNLPLVFDKISNMTAWDLNNDRDRHYVGGNGTVILFMLNSATLGTTEEEYILYQAQKMKEKTPDFRLIFATSASNIGVLQNVVSNVSDVLQISLTTTQTNVATIMAPVLQRILLVPRRIVNPSCNFDWTDTTSGTQRFDDYVEPRMINFYRLHPNYFYSSNSNRRVRIESTSTTHLRVCFSRSIMQPRYDNLTTIVDAENPVTCQDLTSSGNVEANLENACNGYSYIGACPPLYISVQSVVTNDNTYPRTCTENACRYPYSIRYSVVVQDLGCYSSASKLLSTLIFIILPVLLNL